MSRIGKQPIGIPEGVTIDIKPGFIVVKGKNGELSQNFDKRIKIKEEDAKLIISRTEDSKEEKALHGLTRSLVANMLEGVSKGFEKRMEIIGVGYRAQVNGNKVELTLGFSHPVIMEVPEGLSAEMNAETKHLIVRGADKQKVGQFAANIREWRKPEPYKGKGIRYVGEYVVRKAGKTAGK